MSILIKVKIIPIMVKDLSLGQVNLLGKLLRIFYMKNSFFFQFYIFFGDLV